jgi:choline-glycine betaine transporter
MKFREELRDFAAFVALLIGVAAALLVLLGVGDWMQGLSWLERVGAAMLVGLVVALGFGVWLR